MVSSFSMKSRSSTSLRKSQFVITPFTQTRVENGIKTVRYEEALLSKPPIAVTVPPPTQPPTDVHPAFRPSFEHIGEDGRKRDSGLGNTTGSRCENRLNTKISASSSLRSTRQHIEENLSAGANIDSSRQTFIHSLASGTEFSCPSSIVYPEFSDNRNKNHRQATSRASAEKEFTICDQERFFSIQTKIPTEQWLRDGYWEQLSFSKRGSAMVDEHEAVKVHARANAIIRQPISSMSTNTSDLSADTQRESKNIRSMYEYGSIVIDEEEEIDSNPSNNDSNATAGDKVLSRISITVAPTRSENNLSGRFKHELAGGIEDWEDIDGSDIDRYGFISKSGSNTQLRTPELALPRRTSTVLQLATDKPRRRRGIYRISSAVMSLQKIPYRSASMKTIRPSSPTKSLKDPLMDSQSWAVGAYLPTSRYRRVVDEACDMLTLPHGLASISEVEGKKLADSLKKKEWERAEKWRKMAKIITPSPGGEGMKFEFDTKSSKLIYRTWKGIPDRWRAAAWYSFLRASANKYNKCTSESEILDVFHKLIQESSIDDVQIDIDVPRTINSHIMFRKRYRGGQRLLFRVLHCLSLYFPRTGYVQGMASLAATLLCYYDEEKAFIMLVRLWTLRGMDMLYEPGFKSLMITLEDFQNNWIDNQAVSKKLKDLCIEPTAYGTRWYLTLFNYSVPFSAQLRVWDIFMLLGDTDPSPKIEKPIGDGLIILHAISAALIDATREILLESDFEIAMKTLTSWIPIKDNELFMKVARAEWKLHNRK